MADLYTVDRLWPDPQSGLDLDEAFRDLALPDPPNHRRVLIATNMVTTIDGRAQRMGTAEGLSGRADRRLMRLYRLGFDAVGSGIGSLLLDGGPTTNAAFLAAGCLDELYWTVGARVLATEALPMLTPIRGGSPFADAPREATLISAHRFESELFLRYRFEPASVDG